MIGTRLRFLIAAATFLWPVIAAVTTPAVAWPLKAAGAAIAAAALVRPVWGLLIVLAVLPLDTYIWAFLDPPFGTEIVGEIVLAAFLSGACARLAFASTRTTDSCWLGAPALMMGAVVAGSGAFMLGTVQIVTSWPSVFVHDLWRHLTSSYLVDRSTFAPFHLAFNWIEGLALAVVAERVTRSERASWPALVRMFAAGALCASIPACVRLVEVSLRQADPWAASLRFLRTLRTPGILNDFNAVGALLAIYAVALIWIGRHRLGYWIVSVPVLLALWLTGSRGAQLACLVSLTGLWFFNLRSRTVRVAVAAAAAALMLTVVLWNQGRQSQSSSSVAIETRVAMARVGLHIAAEEPVFGVGLGQFRRVSRRFISDSVIELFPQAAIGENAHNNFLQILAELGGLGLIGFVWLCVAFVRSARRAGFPIESPEAAAEPDATPPGGFIPAARIGLTGGVVAFLISCLASHPLLITEVLWIFLLVTGVTAGLTPAPPASRIPWPRMATAAVLLIVLVAVPIRLWHYRQNADLTGLMIGVRGEAAVVDNVAYYATEPRSGWFISASTRVIEMPLRATDDSAAPCRVHVAIDGRRVNTVTVPAREWSTTVLELPGDGHGRKSSLLAFDVESPDCALMVGRFISR